MFREKRAKAEFGDFQTPLNLAREVCLAVKRSGFSPDSVIEPTCGRGAFLEASAEVFPEAIHFLGVDRNPLYIQQAKAVVDRLRQDQRACLIESDFFNTDWQSLVADLPDPILILGNPPWVTNASLGGMGSTNLPEKANHDNLEGINALTGHSNFDISESMLRLNLNWIAARLGMLAVLCKTTVARKVLSYAWSRELPIEQASIHRIDAKAHFGASVDACLLLVNCRPGAKSKDCSDYPSLEATKPDTVFGIRDEILVANVHHYDRWHELLGKGLSGWRSGIKHDCSKVFELIRRNTEYVNGFGERVDIEADVVFPLLKSSDLSNRRHPRKWLLVPQRTMTASPEDLQFYAPKAWQYLLSNTSVIAKRGSSIYRDRPRFSVFGVGDYSFACWKVAISGLQKNLGFVEVAPFQGRPVVLDDTCYFFACESEQECRVLYRLLESEPAQEFWSSYVFWDSKRPITARILNLLDFEALARATGMESEVTHTLADRQLVNYKEGPRQALLFREDTEEWCIQPSNH